MSKVLIVDDEIELCNTLSELLQTIYPDITCDTCYSGEAALEKLKTSTYELLITDMKMPGMNGLELIQKVASDFSPKPNIFAMTGYSETVRADAVRAGAINLFQKPGELQDMIKEASKYL